MNNPWLYEFPMWVSAALFLAVLLLGLEGGFRAGLRRYRMRGKGDKTERGDVTLASMFAVLGLVLAFTYSFSLSRADLRKQAILNETNAIGTAFLRAGLAPESGGKELRERLLDYARTRSVTAENAANSVQMRQTIARSLTAQAQLWPATVRLVQGGMQGPIGVSIVQAVNDVVDAHSLRIAVIFDRLPDAVLAMLVFIAAASMSVAGYNAGLRGRMNRLRMTVFTLVLAALMLTITDFDRPLSGAIQVSHHSLVALIENMEKALAE